jgi:hypothetical protein
MNSEKLLKLFLCILILGAVLKLVVVSSDNKPSPTSALNTKTISTHITKPITPSIPSHIVVKASSLNSNNKSNENDKCNYTKEAAQQDIKEGKEESVRKVKRCNDRCTAGNDSVGCKSCLDLLPVMDPMYNMREMSKQIILLEDHLFQSEKRCNDCICKHFLTIEALAEEAITLDKDHKYPELAEIPTKVRAITKKYVANKKDSEQNIKTGQELRELRKSIMQKSFNHF